MFGCPLFSLAPWISLVGRRFDRSIDRSLIIVFGSFFLVVVSGLYFSPTDTTTSPLVLGDLTPTQMPASVPFRDPCSFISAPRPFLLHSPSCLLPEHAPADAGVWRCPSGGGLRPQPLCLSRAADHRLWRRLLLPVLPTLDV